MSRKVAKQPSPPSPGEVLKSYILGSNFQKERITQDELAKAMKLSRLSVNELVRGKRAINAKTALKLARILDTSPEFWLDLQREVDLAEARKELGSLLDRLPVLRNAPDFR